ncbi:MAG: hypothetical protein COB02_11750, partial [Candidatus Cloacimonadota bacterium]
MPFAAVAAGTASAGAISTLAIIQVGLGITSAVIMKKQAKKQQRAYQDALNASSKIQASTQVVQVPTKERETIYGQNVKVGGNVIFDHIPENNKNYRYSIIVPASHSIEWATNLETGQKKLYINGEGFNTFSDRDGWMTVLDDNAQPNKYTDKFFFRANFEANGIADAKLIEEIPDKWTSNHKLTNVPHIILKLKYDPEVFQSFNLDLSFRVNGKSIYDPRNASYSRSANVALCMLDYVKDINSGMGVSDDDIDLQSFISASNICDEVVNSLKRYELHGKVSSEQSHENVLNSIMKVCSGDLFTVGGKLKFYVGAWRAPVLHLSEDDFRSQITRINNKDKTELINTVRGIYIDPVSGQPTSYTTIKDNILITKDDGELALNLDYDLCNRTEQCQRVANIELKENRNEVLISLSVSLKAIQVHAKDTIYFSCEKYGWVNKIFEISTFSLGSIEGNELVVNLVLKETSSTIFDTFTTAAYSQNKTTNIPKINDVTAPTNLVVTESLKTLGTVPQTWVNFTWDVADSYYTKEYRVRYKKSGQNYISQGSFQSNSIDLAIKESGDYIFEVQTINVKGLSSSYTQISKTITGLQTKPNDLVFNTCTYSKNLEISWVQDTKPYFNYTEIRLDQNFGVNDNKLLYKGVDLSFSIDGSIIANTLSLRGITLYGKHFNTSNISSLNISSKALSNTKPSIPTITSKLDNNKVYFEIDRSSLADDTLGFRLYMSATSGGAFTKVSEVDSFTSTISYVIPFDSSEWDGKESINKFFKVSSFDILTDIKNDESQSTTNEISITFTYLDQQALSVSSLSDLRNVQLFRLENWKVPGISLLAQIDFDSTKTYSQLLTLEKTKTYSISWNILQGSPTLTFTSNSINYELSLSTKYIRFTIDASDEDITFSINGNNLDSVNQIMINEGRNSFPYDLHRDDQPIQSKTRSSLNILTSQIGNVLKLINALDDKVSEQGSTITQQDYEISLKVKKGNIISEIALNEQGAKISGKSIIIDGFTRFINSQKISYGEVKKINGSSVIVSTGSVKKLETNGTLYQDDSNFTYSNKSIDKDSGDITLTISSGTPKLDFYASDNIDSTSIDGDIIKTGSIHASKIVSKSIGTDLLKADEIFTDRLEVTGNQNIIISGDDGILVFSND